MEQKTIEGNIVTVKEVIKDAVDRTKSETPPFFERIKRWAKIGAKISGSIAVVGFGVISTCTTAGIALPIWVTIGIGVASGIGTLGAGFGIGLVNAANMTTTNKELLTRPSNEQIKK
jgi:hypothetical protein